MLPPDSECLTMGLAVFLSTNGQFLGKNHGAASDSIPVKHLNGCLVAQLQILWHFSGLKQLRSEDEFTGSFGYFEGVSLFAVSKWSLLIIVCGGLLLQNYWNLFLTGFFAKSVLAVAYRGEPSDTFIYKYLALPFSWYFHTFGLTQKRRGTSLYAFGSAHNSHP